MKHLIALLLMISTATAQTSNPALELGYIGYVGGKHTFTIKNKLACDAVVKVDLAGVVTERVVAKNATIEVQVASVHEVTLRVKKESASCETGFNGWILITSPAVLPTTFKSVKASRVAYRTIKVTFEAVEDANLQRYEMKVSEDGKIFKTINVLFPNGVQGDKVYTATIKY